MTEIVQSRFTLRELLSIITQLATLFGLPPLHRDEDYFCTLANGLIDAKVMVNGNVYSTNCMTCMQAFTIVREMVCDPKAIKRSTSIIAQKIQEPGELMWNIATIQFGIAIIQLTNLNATLFTQKLTEYPWETKAKKKRVLAVASAMNEFAAKKGIGVNTNHCMNCDSRDCFEVLGQW